MDWYLIVKTLHIISSTIVFGTGIGTAFFMLRSFFTDDIHEKYYAARSTVMADYIFTFPAVIFQPLSGIVLINLAGHDWNSSWLIWTYALYALAGACWIPVIWIQIELKKMLKQAVETGAPLPERYNRLFKIWFILGWPAFLGLVVIFYLMVSRPV
ncbi:MAG: hypothetical protein AUJ12_09900 [Alphaproteobacteria bacterium CG1_02_46_17]|nr:MAG: hypothetical protein AUJ12_09900 [Alphaproteobacteria bacterium CG1_02_46_17]